jgi:probable F420-dependent oxidoreductase
VTPPIRLGAKVPNTGTLPFEPGIARMAAMLESAGFQSIWISDHVVFPHTVRSRYPFAADGRITWPVELDYLEPVVGLSAMTSTTSKAELGTSVLILPMRNPVLFAKQAACIDMLSHGRLVLGVGAGWLREEFEALGADFDARGSVLDEWLAIARSCWTGSAGPFEGRHYRLPEAIYSRPVPARHVPVLIGGMTRHALERAGRIADGWLGQYSIEELSEDHVARCVETMAAAARSAGRRLDGADAFRVVVRVTGAAQKLEVFAGRLPELAAAGATEVVVDVSWEGDEGPRRSFDALRATAA